MAKQRGIIKLEGTIGDITFYKSGKLNIMNILDRIVAPTPKFFKKVRTVGLVLAAVSASLLAAPVALPAVVVQIAGYLAVAGSVATAVSQVATMEEGLETKTGNDGN